MLPLLTRWPAWYQVLVGYTAAMGVWAVREASRRVARIAQASPSSAAPYDKGQLAGQRAATWIRALPWFVGAVLLLSGQRWALTLVAVGYALSARRAYGAFAQGFAEGRKSAELAAAPEYVAGRAIPDRMAFFLAGVFVALTRLLPLGATLVATTWLGR